MDQGWLKIKAASKYAGLSVRTMRSFLKTGLRYSRLPSGTVLIKLQDIDHYLESYAVTNQNPVDDIVRNTLSEMGALS